MDHVAPLNDTQRTRGLEAITQDLLLMSMKVIEHNYSMACHRSNLGQYLSRGANNPHVYCVSSGSFSLCSPDLIGETEAVQPLLINVSNDSSLFS